LYCRLCLARRVVIVSC